MAATPHATRVDFRDAFAGIAFPTSKSGVLNKCRDCGGIDREVFAILLQLPNRPFASLDDLQEAVRAIYLAVGVAPDDLPV
jgi:hypothetical protein